MSLIKVNLYTYRLDGNESTIKTILIFEEISVYLLEVIQRRRETLRIVEIGTHLFICSRLSARNNDNGEQPLRKLLLN